ncbi:hypothetical protein [Candidatus Tisiphia endosymbiont of Ditula angustiorana]
MLKSVDFQGQDLAIKDNTSDYPIPPEVTEQTFNSLLGSLQEPPDF